MSNPYQSPNLEAREVDLQQTVHRKRHPLRVALVSLVLGGVCGGATGAISAGALGLARGIAEYRSYDPSLDADDEANGIGREAIFLLPIFGAILGAQLAAFGGAVLGLIFGAIAGCISSPHRLRITLGAAVSSALLGAATGALGGAILADAPGYQGVFWPLLGGVLGFAGGLIGGGLLGHGIGRIAWGPAQRVAKAILAERVAP